PPAHRLDIGQHGFLDDALPPLDAPPIDPGRLFAFDRPDLPLELEIGSGKGTFLVQQAPHHPETNFLGVEYALKYFRVAADRARRHALPNVRLLHADAGPLIRNHLAPASLRHIHIYFPDPWPKARHHKRRFVNADNLATLHGLLAPDGTVRLATDHADYFAWMEEHAAKVAHLYDRQPFVPPDSADDGELVGSNFERKYRDEGRSFNGMILARR
ncbi:MAG: tRNA (guanosine(46)-N7)-methyltransferase TrmB, partial [Planctomycetota bacterium]